MVYKYQNTNSKMFLEIFLLALLIAVILVRVLASIKLATEHAIAHWTRASIVNNASQILRRSARIQEREQEQSKKVRNVSPQLLARRQTYQR
jgi:hypothetical protein